MTISIRKGTAEDLPVFLNLLREIREAMPQKDWFYLDPPEIFREMMDSGMMHFWMAQDGERTAGVMSILIPALNEVNYGYELGFSQEQLLKVVNMDTVGVHPDYRGLGLQRRLHQTAHTWLEGEERILLCTIHPENCYSLNNARMMGYEIQKEIPIYSSTRYLLQKNLKKE